MPWNVLPPTTQYDTVVLALASSMKIPFLPESASVPEHGNDQLGQSQAHIGAEIYFKHIAVDS